MGYRGKPISPWFIANLTANQTTNLSNGNHVEFNAGFGIGGITLSTGTGQQLGIFTLPVGWIYRVHHALRASLSNSTATIQWQNDPGNSGAIGINGNNTMTTQINDPGQSSTISPMSGLNNLIDCRTTSQSIKLVKVSGTVTNYTATSVVFIEGLSN